MPPSTFDLPSVLGGITLTAKDIHTTRHRFEVVGVDALAVAAEVIQLKSQRNNTFGSFV